MYCINCGKKNEPDSRFCVHCGSPIDQEAPTARAIPSEGALSPPGQEFGSWSPSYRFPRLSQEQVSAVFDDVEVRRSFVNRSKRYKPIPDKPFPVPRLVVTNKRIIFLNRKDELLNLDVTLERIPIREEWRDELTQEYIPPEYSHFPGGPRRFDTYRLGSFWTLTRSANEDLHRQFRKDPSTHSNWKPRTAWWVKGSLIWSWVGGESACVVSESPKIVDFHELTRIQAIAQSGPGRQLPGSTMDGWAQVKLKNAEEAQRLIDKVNGFIEPPNESPFSQDYLASVPAKPMSASYRAYYYFFWIFLAAPFAVVLLLMPVKVVAAALGVPIPVWFIVLALPAGCFAAFRILKRSRRKQKRS